MPFENIHAAEKFYKEYAHFRKRLLLLEIIVGFKILPFLMK